MGKDLNRQLTKEDMQIANHRTRRCSTSYVTRELQIKATMRYCYTAIRMATIQNTNKYVQQALMQLLVRTQNDTTTLEN